jgi:hypothetical protein
VLLLFVKGQACVAEVVKSNTKGKEQKAIGKTPNQLHHLINQSPTGQKQKKGPGIYHLPALCVTKDLVLC